MRNRVIVFKSIHRIRVDANFFENGERKALKGGKSGHTLIQNRDSS